MCGEQFLAYHTRFYLPGSPPRVRGTEQMLGQTDETFGITPACAGNRRVSLWRCVSDQDHPRVCGEQKPSLRYKRQHAGSPPRVRGTVDTDEIDIRHMRITPACAGNRARRSYLNACFRDHPRVCGEQWHITMICQTCVGSPPRVRGTVNVLPCLFLLMGITPACAGNSA